MRWRFIMTDFSKHSTMEKYAFILMVIIVANQNADASLVELCEADHQCPPGYFCYLETNYCSPCTDCQAKHRHNSTLNRCTKGYSKCGPCQTGFQEEILTSGKPRELCVPVEKVEEEKKDGNIFVIASMFIVMILLTLFVAAISLIHARKVCIRTNRQIDVCEDPPPYSSLAPVIENSSNIGVEHNRLVQAEIVNERDRDVEVASTCGTAISERSHSSWIERKAENLQEAVPFCQPTYITQNTLDQDDSGISEVDNGSAEISPSWHADLHDESTMPSDWTPNMISVSENREMDVDEGACTEASCGERDGGDDVYMSSQDQMEQQHSSQQMQLASSRSPQSECN
ncbi:hypothetical protein LSTR_LSTR002913 [Laodelphax striatellus]|uniref:Uncharacterized protein n=1 Tax=Laodelphax striatellus TaxID=195883 RepID=A0A482XMX9_LAOST|nr:hypothetical protein LSTR_LSTR002913 [Laodelphax striatellus]